MSKTLESTSLLSIKDIENLKSSNVDVKMQNKAKTLDSSIEKYNKNYVKALEAPVPNIRLHFNEVLVRAVPYEIKTRSGLILSVADSDFKMADKLERISEAISQTQEILMVGDMVSEEEQRKGLRPGRMCKFSLNRFRQLSDRHNRGMIETEYQVPSETIKGYKYLILDKRDIIYTADKEYLAEEQD